jgi:hypothetical protein
VRARSYRLTMPNRQNVISPGAHVAHVALDDPVGGAKVGVVEEYVGDDQSGVVIMRGAGGVPEGYDRREIISLRHLGWLSSGPVILSPRHLWALLRRPWGVLSVLLALVLAAGLVSLSYRYHWGKGVVVAVGVGLAVLTVTLVLADQYLLHRSSRD